MVQKRQRWLPWILFCMQDWLGLWQWWKAQLIKHYSNKKHQENIKRAKDSKQAKLTLVLEDQPQPTTSQGFSAAGILTTTSDLTLKADFLCLTKLASSNFSFQSSDNIGSFCFKQCFLTVMLPILLAWDRQRHLTLLERPWDHTSSK